MWTRELKQAYHSQKGCAKFRGIDWCFTPDEWLKVWLDSGQINNRGRTRGKYCMSRIGDSGPYSVSNVVIKTHSDNLSEAHLGKPKSPFTAIHRARIGEANRRRNRKIKEIAQ